MKRLTIDQISEEKLFFYDIETDNQYAPYAKLKLVVAQVGLRGERYVVRTAAQWKDLKRRLADPTVQKFGWNNKSFDDIVLDRHGFAVCESGSHDLMLAAKTVAPYLASYSLKFVNWHYFGDPHFPEMELERYAMHKGVDKWSITGPMMERYALHDIVQTQAMFQLFWDVVTRPKHWQAYLLDLSQGEVVKEMELEGGLFLDAEDITAQVASVQNVKLYWEQQAFQRSGGKVQNPNSSKQMGLYLDSQNFDLELSDNGEFSVPKSLLLDLLDLDNPANDRDSVARCAYEVRQVNAQLKYYENYLKALAHKQLDIDAHRPKNWIPVQLSISNARTRRYTSNSMFKLNFQNPNKAAREVQLVPPDSVGIWIDSTQVENVVHIYESKDIARRKAYEADENWNEYVWLANQILGDNRGKEELDSIPSEQVPHWTIYKQFKTCKLALNFGMGVARFSESCGVTERVGKTMFDLVHEACPAIHKLQDRVGRDLVQNGEVTDVFGHIYTGSARKAYKVVAYLIQGCGTGSLPKAQLRANLDTIRAHPNAGVMCGTCHDESAMRLRLENGAGTNFAILQKLMVNMTSMFSPKFDNIPLRAKLYLSRTTNHDRQEVSITDEEKVKSFLC